MKILVIPDCQIKEGVAREHLRWAGEAVCDYRPDVVVNLGDFADMPSLSTHDVKGSKYFEGLRYKKDITAAKEAMQELLAPLRALQKTQKETKHKVYKPRMVMLLGNHENRIDRAINNNPTLEGLISTTDLIYEKDWEVMHFYILFSLMELASTIIGLLVLWVGLLVQPVLSLANSTCPASQDTSKESKLHTAREQMGKPFVL